MSTETNGGGVVPSPVGGQPITQTLLRITGTVFTDRVLNKGEAIHVVVTDDTGDVVANGYGQVEDVAFKDVYKRVEGERVFDHARRIDIAKVT